MKALIGNIQKFSSEDGPGIRTTVFLKGCPLRCRWCHNPEMISYEQQLIQMPNSCIGCGYCLTHCPQKAVSVDRNGKIRVDREKCDGCYACTDFCYAGALRKVAREMTPEEVMYEVLQDKDFYDSTGGGMTISGGELLSHVAFVDALLDIAAKEGIQVCLDTSGYGDGGELYRLAKEQHVAHVLYDIKGLDDKMHQRYTGRSNALILENLRRLAADPETRDKLQMRMPLILGVNDTPDMIEATAQLYKQLGLKRVTLLPYHDLGNGKMRNIGGKPECFSPPSDQRLEEIRRCFYDQAGMEVEILGRVE